MKLKVDARFVIEVDRQNPADGLKLVLSWLLNQVGRPLEVFDPEMEEEEKVGEIQFDPEARIEVAGEILEL
jgi:hypothetical protein